jgi:hypothetical protein
MIDSAAEIQPKNRGIEIKHYNNVDVIVNTQIPQDEKLQALVGLFRNGLPEDWVLYSPTKEQEYWNLHVDNIDNPIYFAKRRKHTSPFIIQQFKKYDLLGSKSKEVALYETNSLINEMRVAPVVDDVLRSESVTQLVRKYGYTDISLVLPLIGVIERQTGEKVMVYDFVRGSNYWSEDFEKEKMKIKARGQNAEDDLMGELSRLLQQNGINPWDMQSTRQLIESVDELGNSHLHLADIEGFSLISK